MENTRQQHFQEDEVTLKDLILKIQDWWKYLLSKWLTIIIVGLVGAGIGLTMSLLDKPDYKGELTFVVEDNSSSPLSAYAGLASQFGIDLGGRGSGTGVFEGDNVIEFLKSRLMIERALLSSVTYQGKTMSLAELYIDAYELRDKWKRPELRTLKFPVTETREGFSLVQDSVLNVIHEQIVKGKYKVEKLDKKLSFIKVQCISASEVFSKVFIQHIVDQAGSFYIDTKTRHNKINIDRLQQQADSLEKLLNRKTYSAAAIQDLNLNPARQAAGVNTELAVRDKFMLQTMYAEVVKNLELSKIAMAQETPVIQIVDRPILPLKKERLGKAKGIILGGILGGFLIVVFLLARKIYSDTMRGRG
ncbi:lipopolysaccharide biosynthesis protein [uncultured Chitinophaga sp.]|jgi:Uncharacterized protein involved in exopolysaccharide biosynthesis|uniref:lipopolysaccharide biosynthesis protein n=1 Tax=uncultured Chitinophaga sp. TaxID=339340 RepID=UPI0026372CF9|nr:lipopolysaccharide biosynthesis protein [uncultured Chitinophaga sp.]